MNISPTEYNQIREIKREQRPCKCGGHKVYVEAERDERGSVIYPAQFMCERCGECELVREKHVYPVA